jgi:hypothetical protein
MDTDRSQQQKKHAGLPGPATQGTRQNRIILYARTLCREAQSFRHEMAHFSSGAITL